MCDIIETCYIVNQLEELKRKNASLQSQLEIANFIINDSKCNGLLNCSIDDLYLGEQKDFILSILEQVKNKCLPGTRPYEIIESILSVNNKTGIGDKLAKDVWNIIGKCSQIGEKEISQLHELGFNYVSSKKHPKLKFADRYLFTLPSTSSDSRHALKNMASEISHCIAPTLKI